MTENLPFGWSEATLPDLVGEGGVFSDGDWVESIDQDPSGDVRLIQLADVGDGVYENRSSRFLTSEKAAELRCTFLVRGDVLVARMPDPLGRACMFPGDEKAAVTVVDVCVVRTGRLGPDHRWLMWTLNSPQVRAAVASLQSGSTRKRISRGNLATIRFPVPPLAEQRRIVAALEEHLSELDAAVAGLERARVNAERLRRAVLARTVQHARSANHAHAKSSPIVTIGEIADVGTGATPLRSNRSYYEGGNIPWITSGALNEAVVRESRELVTQRALRETNLTLYPPGTLLLAMYGEGKTRGKCSELAIAATTNQAIAAIRLRKEFEHCRPWLKLVLHAFYEEMRAFASGGVQPNLNLSIVRSLSLPLPDWERMEMLLNEAERSLSVAAQSRKAIDVQLARATRLRQSILKHAFEGKLVPQDPNDEPASVLLDRILAECASASAPQRRTRAKSKATSRSRRA